MNAKTWTHSEIYDLISKNDVAAMRAVCALFRRQTEDEKSAKQTRHLNGRGFSAAHARTGSVLADWMSMGRGDGEYRRSLGGRMVFGGKLMNRVDVARHLALAYVGQLTETANRNERRRAQEATDAHFYA